MKPTLFNPLPLVASLVVFTTVSGGGDPLPQAPVDFTKGLQGTFNADWEGVAGRTYFMQFSLNLVDWHYAPFIDYGDGGHHRGIDSDSEKLFLRLHHGDFPGIESLDDAVNADFDGDGIPNAYEVFYDCDYDYGFSPLSADSEGAFLAHVAGQPAAPAVFEVHTPLR